MASTELSTWTDTNDYRVRLISVSSFHRAVSTSEMSVLTLDTTPVVRESQRVEYATITPTHSPGSMQVFKSSPSRTFGISARLVSRTPEEALNNMKRLQLIRAWTKPYFGESHTLDQNYEVSQTVSTRLSDTSDPTTENNSSTGSYDMLGAPPEVLYFYAYASSNQRAETTMIARSSRQQAINFHKIPVVITDYEFTFPDDVDYIPTSDAIASPFPVRMDISFTLLETHAPIEYTTFNLADYQRGRLVGF